MTRDLYKGFAERYDLFHDKFDEHDSLIVDFFRKIFSKNEVLSVLDCACGTGKDLHLLHSLELEVTGADISDSMLAQAQRNMTTYDFKVPLYKVDYRHLPQYFDRKFDAIVCLSSSILHMPNDSEVLSAFKSMREVLREGGILVLNQGATDKFWEKKPRFILEKNTKDFSRLFVIDYSSRGARFNILDVFHSEGSYDLKVWSVDYPRILLKDNYERLLKTSGFKIIDFYGNYNFDLYKKEKSDLLIVIAHKTKNVK